MLSIRQELCPPTCGVMMTFGHRPEAAFGRQRLGIRHVHHCAGEMARIERRHQVVA